MGFSSRAQEHRLWSLASVILSPSSSVHSLRCRIRDFSLHFTFLICKVGTVEPLQRLSEFPKS